MTLLWMVREAKGLELIVMSIFYLEVLGLPFCVEEVSRVA